DGGAGEPLSGDALDGGAGEPLSGDALDGGAGEPLSGDALDGGAAEPLSGDAPEGESGRRTGDSAPQDGRPPGARLRRAVAAGAATVLVLGGCGFLHAAHELRSDESARNRALTDTEATSRVAGDVGSALARIFSYTPDGTAAAERSARTALDGKAARQYTALFDRVRQDLTAQRVTLSTRAVRTGVVELDGDRARLLVFLDQTSRRGEDAATTAAAQLTVTARLEDDRWRIVDIKAR
ncbi:Mce-associated membrane protein, partial [Streptomyces sp. di188]